MTLSAVSLFNVRSTRPCRRMPTMTSATPRRCASCCNGGGWRAKGDMNGPVDRVARPDREGTSIAQHSRICPPTPDSAMSCYQASSRSKGTSPMVAGTCDANYPRDHICTRD